MENYDENYVDPVDRVLDNFREINIEEKLNDMLR